MTCLFLPAIVWHDYNQKLFCVWCYFVQITWQGNPCNWYKYSLFLRFSCAMILIRMCRNWSCQDYGCWNWDNCYLGWTYFVYVRQWVLNCSSWWRVLISTLHNCFQCVKFLYSWGLMHLWQLLITKCIRDILIVTIMINLSQPKGH